jgi:hypothetical protein
MQGDYCFASTIWISQPGQEKSFDALALGIQWLHILALFFYGFSAWPLFRKGSWSL